jgi:hypothetical protein
VVPVFVLRIRSVEGRSRGLDSVDTESAGPDGGMDCWGAASAS